MSCDARGGRVPGLTHGGRLMHIEVRVRDEEDAVWAAKRQGSSWFGG